MSKKGEIFKVGDVIRPLLHRKLSNDYPIQNIKLAKVVSLKKFNNSGWGEWGYSTNHHKLTIQILDGFVYKHTKNTEKYTVFSGAFTLAVIPEHYEIF